MIAGIICICNPMLALFDLIPDFIGYILILYGLNRLSAISPALDDARPYFRYMLFASIARTLIFFASSTFDETMTLSLTLIFSAIEFGLSVMAIPALYEGLSYLNIRYNGKAKEAPEFKTIGMAFFCVRGIMSLIPMLGYVMYDPDDELITSPDQIVSENWTEYALILNVVNVVITLIIAIFWIAIVVSYIGKLSKDNDFKALIDAAYEQRRRDDPGYFTRRTLCFAFSAANIGAFFLIDLIGDGINLIPDLIFPACMIWVMYLIREYTDSEALKKAYISGGICTVVSVANFIVYTLFMKRRFYAPADTLMARFASEYYLAAAFALAEGVALFIFAQYLYDVFKPIVIKETTPEVPEGFVRSARENEKFIRRSLVLLRVFCVAIQVTSVSTVLLTVLMHFFPLIWLINLGVNIVFFAIASVFFFKLITGIKRRYSITDDTF